MELVVLAALIYETVQQVRELVIKLRIIMDSEVVRSDHKNKPHELPMRIIDRNHPSQAIMVRYYLESCSLDLRMKCPNGPHI